MTQHDQRCEGPDDEKVLADVAEHGWHVVRIFEQEDAPGWAFSIGLYRSFGHPEIIVFGLNPGLMHSIINSVGAEARAGNRVEADNHYPGLIEGYSCTFKGVSKIWYPLFMGYAMWFYKGSDFPALQCIWPDKQSRYPWESGFNQAWLSAQPLLFHEDSESARAVELLKTLDLETPD
jgi:hypothetical protein